MNGPVGLNEANIINQNGVPNYNLSLQRDLDFKNDYLNTTTINTTHLNSDTIKTQSIKEITTNSSKNFFNSANPRQRRRPKVIFN